MAFFDLTQAKTKNQILVNVRGQSAVPPQVMAAFNDVLANVDFPLPKDEIDSLNEDTYEVATGVIYDYMEIAITECELNPEDYNYGVVSCTKLPGGFLLFDLSFITEDSTDETSDEDSEWE